MGANSTQAQAFLVLIVAFVLLAGGLASGGSIMYILGGLALLAVSCGLFLKCKPWEHREE